ncbi:MAG: hypothetical protein JEZ00_02195 [Anaerolineaceae bacterium]|nr:hypothetical protein [Anaerolineaceae bacterium]
MIHFPTPCIFAHRGASADAPENTLPAFELAVQQGAHAIELDAKLSKDGKIVVIHDRTLMRTTNGNGHVHKIDFAALRTLDAGSWFSSKYENVRIPLLEEVLETIGRKIIVNIEVTNYRSPWDSLPEKIAELVKRMKMTQHVMFSSFLPKNLRKLNSYLPGTPIALLTEPHIYGITQWTGIARRTSPEIQHPYLTDVNQDVIEKAHERGIRLHTWTVNKEKDMKRLYQWGVDGIFTDHPAMAISLLSGNNADNGDV